MANLNRMLALLTEDNITNVVGMKHELARERYIVTRRTVASFQELEEEATRYTQYHLTATVGGSAIPQYMVSSQSMNSIEHAFTNLGGLSGAFEIASTGIRGGLRRIIDVLYEAMRREEERRYIEWVLRTFVDPLSFQDRTALMEQYLNRFRYNFPQGCRIPTALEMAGNYESVIMLHMEVINSIRMGIRRT